MHRRIIFSQNSCLPNTELQQIGGVLHGRRPAEDSEAFPIAVLQGIFGPRQAHSLTDSFLSKVDRKSCVVHADQTLPINAVGDGHVRMNRWWTSIGKEIVYGDTNGFGTSLFVSDTSPLGNVYVLDLFCNKAVASSDDEEDSDQVKVSSELTVYWSES